MTEQEAKTKWCPMVHMSSETERVHPMNNREERLTEMGGISRCIGSACMAWRWYRTHINNPAGGAEMVASTRTHGFCGLAGDWHRDDQS